MLGSLAAGVVLGGVITFTLLSYLWEWGIVRGAKWWEVLTALGAMGAVVIASWVGVRDALWRKEKHKSEIEDAKVYVLSIQLLMFKIAVQIGDIPAPEKTENGYETERAYSQSQSLYEMVMGFDLLAIRKVDKAASDTLLAAIKTMSLLSLYLEYANDRSIGAFEHDKKYVSRTLKKSREQLASVLGFQR